MISELGRLLARFGPARGIMCLSLKHHASQRRRRPRHRTEGTRYTWQRSFGGCDFQWAMPGLKNSLGALAQGPAKCARNVFSGWDPWSRNWSRNWDHLGLAWRRLAGPKTSPRTTKNVKDGFFLVSKNGLQKRVQKLDRKFAPVVAGNSGKWNRNLDRFFGPHFWTFSYLHGPHETSSNDPIKALPCPDNCANFHSYVLGGSLWHCGLSAKTLRLVPFENYTVARRP